MRQWIRCQAFWDIFWKMKRADNQSGNSTIWGVVGSGMDVKGKFGKSEVVGENF